MLPEAKSEDEGGAPGSRAAREAWIAWEGSWGQLSPPRVGAARGLSLLATTRFRPVLSLLRECPPEELWSAPSAALRDWGLSSRSAEEFVVHRERISWGITAEALNKCGGRFVPVGSPEYPRELMHLTVPPAGLFVRAALANWERLLGVPRVGVVGTRSVTVNGASTAGSFSAALAAAGIAVVSGLALGADGAAHRGALEVGGLTAAVLGSGVDVPTPGRHRPLYRDLCERGAVISEFPPGFKAARWTFPMRNRILAALSDAVVVIEAGNRSGALITAGEAAGLGRPVFAVPGPIGRHSHRGCNELLYAGAIPALDSQLLVQDFLYQTKNERGNRTGDREREEFDGRPTPESCHCKGRRKARDQTEHPHARLLLKALEAGPLSLDQLAPVAGLSPREVSVAMAMLELDGLAARAGPATYWLTA